MSTLQANTSSCIVPIRPGFGDHALLYISGMAHGATLWNTPVVIKHLGGHYPIAGFNPYPLAGLLSGIKSIANLAASYAPYIESWIGDRSVFFVGGSFGGVIAIALASELERRGRHVARIAMLDTQPPGIPPERTINAEERAMARLRWMYGLSVSQEEHLVELTGAPSIPALREMLMEGMNMQAAIDQYKLTPIAAPVHLLHAEELAAPVIDGIPDEFIRTPEEHAVPDLGWSRYGLALASVVTVPGNHFSMYSYPETAGQIDSLFKPDLCLGTETLGDDALADIWNKRHFEVQLESGQSTAS